MGDRPATGRRPRGRRRAWAVLVAVVAALMAPVMVAPAALAVEIPPSVREIADRLLNGPVAECYDDGAPGTRHPETGACLAYSTGTAPLGTIKPAVSSALAGVTSAATSSGFRQFLAGCSSNKSVCATLALSSIAALLGIGAGTQEILELIAEPNPDAAPGLDPSGWPEGGYFEPSGENQRTAVTPISATRRASDNAIEFHFQLTLLQWGNGDPGDWYRSTNSSFGYDFQCRSSDGNYSGLLSGSTSGGFGGPDGQIGDTQMVTIVIDSPFCRDGSVNYSRVRGTAGSHGISQFHTWGAQNTPTGGAGEDYRTDGTTGGSRLECRDSLGSSYYVETSAPAGTWDIPAPKCLDGDIPTGLEVGSRAPGGGLTSDTAYDLSPETLRPAAGGPYPQCVGSACLYTVKVDGKVCGVGDAECVRWTQNPAAQCWYGPYQVDRSACYLLERSYEVQSPSVPATRPNTDGDPTTSSPPAVEELPAPGTTRPAECRSAYFALGAVQPALVSAVDAVYEANQSAISTVYGYRPSDPFPDHPSGIAADFMVRSTAGGHAVANHILANASAYNVKYVLWNQQSWNPSRGTWEPMSDRGSDTANHKDHVHLTINATGGSNACGASPQPTSGEDVDRMNDACFPSGVAAFNPLEWVLRPTKCAMAWAFIPGVTFTDGSMSYNVGNYLTEWLEGSRTPFDNSPLGGWKAFIGGVGGSFSAVGASVSCEGPAVPTAMLGEAGVLPDVIYPFRACEGVMATAAATSRMVLTGIIAWGTLWRVTRIIGAPFGYNLEAIGRSGRVS